jgi:pyridoxine 4-dehydrogenase
MMAERRPASLVIGGDLPVRRIGYGAMRLTGPGIWGEPEDRDGAIRLLRRSLDLGVSFIDTADSYGPAVNEELIREALYPYPSHLVIATKGGFVRPGPDRWVAVGRPAYLRQQVEMSLRRLGLDRIDLYQLHRVDPEVDVADQIGELKALQDEGKIRHIGLSEVGLATIQQARKTAGIVSVQNRYNLVDRQYDDVLEYAESEGLVFIPWSPLGDGKLADVQGTLGTAATWCNMTPAQLTLAWLLRRSPVMLPIPGTSSVTHLEENMSAISVELDDVIYDQLTAVGESD